MLPPPRGALKVDRANHMLHFLESKGLDLIVVLALQREHAIGGHIGQYSPKSRAIGQLPRVEPTIGSIKVGKIALMQLLKVASLHVSKVAQLLDAPTHVAQQLFEVIVDACHIFQRNGVGGIAQKFFLIDVDAYANN